ncbi:MAG: hypothetical protein ABI977_16270, partial [Acidobacteriota bacterium]
MKHLGPKLLILTALFFTSASYGQQNASSGKMAEFLKTNWEVKTETNEWQFTGKFLALPLQLQDDLLTSFPKHRFSLAEMRFVGHYPGTNYPLVVITDAENGEVVGFVRQLNWGIASKSFGDLFGAYQADNKQDLEKRVVVLATLIASTDARGSVGRIMRKKTALSVDLQWAGGVWRRLEAHFDKQLRITRISLANASNR